MLLLRRSINWLTIGNPFLRTRWGVHLSILFALVLVATTYATTFAQGGSTLYLPLTSGGEGFPIIPNQYIVVLQEGAVAGNEPLAVSAAAQATALVAQYGGSAVLHTYDAALYGFAATLPPEAAEAMQDDPAVARVEPDRLVWISQATPDATQPGAIWGLDRIDQRTPALDQQYTYTATGAGVHAYIIDTGIRTSHAQFADRIGEGFTAINYDGRGVLDCNGHGTHVAGTVGGITYGVAKEVTLHPVRTLGCNGSGPLSGVIAGVDWVTANHVKPAVANMSLGGSISATLDEAVRNSINSGVTYVVAAGNDNHNACNYSPARVDMALTVGATTNTDSRSFFSNTKASNYGACLDIFAPGSSILSAGHTGNTAAVSFSGTSMASPHVAGAVALYLEMNPLATPAEVTTAVLNAATPDVVHNIGSGSPNRLLYTIALQAGEGTTPPDPTPPDPTPEPTPELCQELTDNGDFEEDAATWQESSTQGFRLICTQETCGAGLQPHSGSTLAWLGGGNSEQSLLSQTVTIPVDQPAYLSYWYWIESEDYCGYDYGYARLFVDNSLRTVQRYSLCNSARTNGWAVEMIDLSDYAGRTVRLDFYVATDRSMISSLFIDDVFLRSGSSCTLGGSAGMMPSALNVPLDELFAEPPEVPKHESSPVGDAVWRR